MEPIAREVNRLEFSAASDVGLVRSRNEDNFVLVPLREGALLAVADGVGGSRSGEVASEIAAQTFVELLSQPAAGASPPDPSVLANALAQANERILFEGRSREHRGMGTTMTAVWASEDKAAYAHAGDSRLYLCRRGELRRITHDHSIAEELVRRGTLPADEAQSHPQRHVLTRYLGLYPFNCDEGTVGLEPGDVLMLCTDGLTDALTERDILAEIESGFDGLALRLVEAANRSGGPDNTTVVAIRITAQAGGTAE